MRENSLSLSAIIIIMRKIIISILIFVNSCISTNIQPTFGKLSGDSTDPIISSTEESSSSSSSGEMSDSEEGNNSKFDVNQYDLYSSVSGDHMVSCQKMDFLFIIDNSASMSDDQIKLGESVNIFIEGLETLSAYEDLYDFNIGVITTDSYVSNIPGCDVIGGLVVSTNSNKCGPYTEGHNFMTKSDNIQESFSCASLVGTGGSGNEQPLFALINSLESWLSLPGHCNEGFSREDALLVVVIITDEDDFSGGTIEDYYDHIVWLKGSDKFIVMTGVIPYSSEICNFEAVKLTEFIQLFQNNYISDICGEDVSYIDFFLDIIDTSRVACDGIVPEG